MTLSDSLNRNDSVKENQVKGKGSVLLYISGRFHQEILLELKNWNVAARLSQRSASSSAGKHLQRKGSAVK